MAIPVETLEKINAMPNDKISIVIQIVDQLSLDPVEKFREIRQRTSRTPMSEEEIDDFVSKVREERNAARS